MFLNYQVKISITTLLGSALFYLRKRELRLFVLAPCRKRQRVKHKVITAHIKTKRNYNYCVHGLRPLALARKRAPPYIATP